MTAIVIALAVLVLTGCGLKDPYATSTTSRLPVARKAPAVAPSLAATSTDTPGQATPLAGARVFMRGYLPYLYGLGRARAIGAVTRALRHALAAQPMTRDDGASPSRPRLEALRLLGASAGQARARAVVSDESQVYFALDLALVRGADGWRVAALKTVGG